MNNKSLKHLLSIVSLGSILLGMAQSSAMVESAGSSSSSDQAPAVAAAEMTLDSLISVPLSGDSSLSIPWTDFAECFGVRARQITTYEQLAVRVGTNTVRVRKNTILEDGRPGQLHFIAKINGPMVDIQHVYSPITLEDWIKERFSGRCLVWMTSYPSVTQYLNELAEAIGSDGTINTDSLLLLGLLKGQTYQLLDTGSLQFLVSTETAENTTTTTSIKVSGSRIYQNLRIEMEAITELAQKNQGPCQLPFHRRELDSINNPQDAAKVRAWLLQNCVQIQAE